MRRRPRRAEHDGLGRCSAPSHSRRVSPGVCASRIITLQRLFDIQYAQTGEANFAAKFSTDFNENHRPEPGMGAPPNGCGVAPSDRRSLGCCFNRVDASVVTFHISANGCLAVDTASYRTEISRSVAGLTSGLEGERIPAGFACHTDIARCCRAPWRRL